MGWSWQNSPSNSFENTSRCWNGSTDGKSSRERETASFRSRFNADPPRFKTRSRQTIKIKTVSRKFFWIDALLDWAAKWWISNPVTQVVIDMLRSDELFCPSTNQVLPLLEQDRQSEAVTVFLFFLPSHPTLLTPPPLPRAFVFSPQLCSHKETKMTARSNWTIDIYNLTEK